MADVDVLIDEEIFPCHSILLSAQSAVLCNMFHDTDKETWSSGLSSFFSGHSEDVVLLFLTLCHSPSHSLDEGKSIYSKVFRVINAPTTISKTPIAEYMDLLHKLDASLLLKHFQERLLEEYGEKKDVLPSFFPAASKLGMVSMKRKCVKQMLKNIIESSTWRLDTPIRTLLKLTKESWDEVTGDDAKLLFEVFARSIDARNSGLILRDAIIDTILRG